MTYRAIAESLGVSAGIVSRDMRALGLGRAMTGGQLRTRRTRERRERLAGRYRELAAQNLYAREIAEQVGVSKEEVRRDLRALGLSRGHGPRDGGLVADDGTPTERGERFAAANAAKQAAVAERIASGRKQCTKCGLTKSLTEDFPAQAASPDGRYCWCRSCTNEYSRERARAAREARREPVEPGALTDWQREQQAAALAFLRRPVTVPERWCCYGDGNGHHARGCPMGRVAVG
jgi:hypothetical protein